MAIRVAINGFGRIGRLVLRAIVESGPPRYRSRRASTIWARSKPTPICCAMTACMAAFPPTVTVDGDIMIAAGHKIKVTAIKNPAELPHKELDVDIALECTGIFTARDKAARASGGRRQARAGLRARRRRRPHRGLWRQPRQADQGSPDRLQRLVHHQLPGAGGQGAERRGRHREGHDDHDPLLHQRPAHRWTRCTRISIAPAPRRCR